jgi:hypothetical protein
MTLLNDIISSGINENKINKRLNDYSYKALKEAKNRLSDVRKPKQSIKSSSKLLNKIVKTSLNEGEINKRLDQAAYAAINGQRQQERGTPEGVTMLGQLNREKPLDAITREMIQEYQEEQQAPIMVDGEARKYMKSDYIPSFTSKFGKDKTTDQIEKMMNDYREGKKYVSNEISKIDEFIKDANDNILKLKKEIEERGTGVNFFNIRNFQAAKNELEILNKERKKAENKLNKYNYTLDKLEEDHKEVIRQNSLINQENREEVIKYEQSLKDLNRNRLNLQQQPNESEYEYYKRLQEVEKEKYDPILYKKYASNQSTKKLNTKLSDLYDDTSFKEEIIKNLSDEEKFAINKDFDSIEQLYLNKNGFNNKSLNPKMAAQELRNALNTIRSNAALLLQSKLKRQPQREIYSDTIQLARDRQDLEARKDAASLLQARLKRRPQQEIYSDTIQLARDRQGLAERQQQAQEARDAASFLKARLKRRPQREIYSDTIQLARDRQDLEERQQQAREEAATNIQRIVRGDQAKIKAALIRNQNRINARNAAREQAIKTLGEQEERTSYFDNADRNLLLEMARQQREEIRQAREAREAAQNQQLERAKNTPIYRDVLKAQKKFKMRKDAATNIQKIVRGIQGRTDAQIIKEQNKINAEKERAVRNLQKIAREYDYRRAETNKRKEQERLQKFRQLQQNLEQSREIKGSELFMEKQQRGITPFIRSMPKNVMEEEEIKRGANERTFFTLKDELSPGGTYLSGTSTIAEQRESGLRKPRADLGSTRGPYKKKTPEERRMEQAQTTLERNMQTAMQRLGNVLPQGQVQTRSQTLNEMLRQPGTKNLQNIGRKLSRIEENKTLQDKLLAKNYANELIDLLAQQEIQKLPKKRKVGRPKKRDEGPAGAGLKGRARKPNKRIVKTSKEDKMKNRLRLVASQIEAGNTNPKLIKEVNELYKTLYDIDNAYMLLKK